MKSDAYKKDERNKASREDTQKSAYFQWSGKGDSGSFYIIIIY